MLNIKNQRPRFSYERSVKIIKGDLFRISNISRNSIYSLKIILSNVNRMDTYTFHGLFEKSRAVLVLAHYIENWESLFIKFRTSDDEVGYMYYSQSKGTKYYLVKG